MELQRASKKLVPLTVKELVRDRKKVKQDRRPRRLSNIYPVHSPAYQKIKDNRCAVTPSGRSSAHPFFPPNTIPMTVNSAKRTTAVTSKMDVFVASPGPFATSPPSSIYEQERSDLGSFCAGSSLSHPSGDSVISDDLGGLDDHLEDSPLETLLTQDVMNTLNLQTTGLNTPSEFSWGGKLDSDASLPAAVETLGSNPTLAQLNMEPDISFVNMLNMDPDDCKFNYSALDFMCNDINSSSQSSMTSVSAVSTGPSPIFVTRGIDSQRCSETISSSSMELEKKNFSDLGNSYIRTAAPAKSNFPPRTTQPQLVGIVPPVMKLEPEEPTACSEKTDDGLGKLKAQSPNLHKLLSKQPIKSEITSASDTLKVKSVTGNAFSDMSVQIVPSSGTNKRTHTDTFKMEPLSPKSVQRPLVKEESTEDKWRDIEHFMHSPGEEPTVKKRRRYDSGSSSHISDDEDEDDISSHGGKDMEYDSDDDYSDIDADLAHITPSNCESLVAMGKKQKQYFWQYNVQSKGPKGTRLKLAVDSPTDPHVLNDFEDPVFDECNTAIAGIRHGGKARKGDGNEITPNPKKLFMIGHQLMRLNRQINACQLGADVPAAKRNESRKEKNKLASRACRLKKKAQHEANKIKLYGLEQEHSELNSVLRYIWPHMKLKAKALMGQSDKSEILSTNSVSLRGLLEAKITQNQKTRVAGHATDYVNSVILKVESGDYNGGLNIKKSHKT